MTCSEIFGFETKVLIGKDHETLMLKPTKETLFGGAALGADRERADSTWDRDVLEKLRAARPQDMRAKQQMEWMLWHRHRSKRAKK